jgi:hypothetical protein
LFLLENRGFFDFRRVVRGWSEGGPRGVRGGSEGGPRVQGVEKKTRHIHTHTKYLTQGKTPKQQQDAKPANTLGRQRQYASKNVPQEPTLSPQPHHAKSAKREPILEWREPLLPQRVKVSLFLLENPNLFGWFVSWVWGQEGMSEWGGGVECGSGVRGSDLFGFVPRVNTRKLTRTSNPK